MRWRNGWGRSSSGTRRRRSDGRFPDPLQQLKDRSRDLFDTVTEKVREALGRGGGSERGDVTPNH
jgi:hypothetical protein